MNEAAASIALKSDCYVPERNRNRRAREGSFVALPAAAYVCFKFLTIAGAQW